FEAENFDKGGEGVAYHDNTAGNAGGQYRTTEDVDIVAGGTGYIVNNFETGAFHVEVDGKDVTGRIAAPYTNDWTAYQWAGKTGVALTAGKHTLKVVVDQQYFNLNQVRVLAS